MFRRITNAPWNGSIRTSSSFLHILRGPSTVLNIVPHATIRNAVNTFEKGKTTIFLHEPFSVGCIFSPWALQKRIMQRLFSKRENRHLPAGLLLGWIYFLSLSSTQENHSKIVFNTQYQRRIVLVSYIVVLTEYCVYSHFPSASQLNSLLASLPVKEAL